MKQNIKDILEIINYVREHYNSSMKSYNINQLRYDAVYQIARRRNVDNTTIANSYIRSLEPAIKGTKQFDKLLKEWLVDDSPELNTIVNSYSNNHLKPFIEEAFAKHSEDDKILASEFGYDFINKEFVEGKEKFRLHIIKERNQHLIREAKSQWAISSKGNLKCSVCNFSFFEHYGELGKNYIEAHHVLPISSLINETVMKISDLTPVCSNCHSMLHRNNAVVTIEELKKHIK